MGACWVTSLLQIPGVEFKGFPKIPRLESGFTVTEKLDGTNACVIVTEDGRVYAQSRHRILTVAHDNYGFAAWVEAHAGQLTELGPGHHFGEWWGQGINRSYGLTERRFSLFNLTKWAYERPECCHVVPKLVGLELDASFFVIEDCVRESIEWLQINGSQAAPGFMNPEGVVLFHHRANQLFKVPFAK
jgi:hypothetical protein